MKLLEMYRALFATENSNEPVPAFFDSLKQNGSFRNILRTIKAEALEIKLYGNSSDTLPIFFDYDFNPKLLHDFNEQYNYLNITVEQEAIYASLFHLIYLASLSYSLVTYESYRRKHLLAYQLLVYFGKNDIEQTLNSIDTFCKINQIAETEIPKFFSIEMRKIDSHSISLSAWQLLIEKSGSLSALPLFNLAIEIEAILKRAPHSLGEAENAIIDSAKSARWSHAELIRILSHLPESLQSKFINSLCEEHVTLLIGENDDQFASSLRQVHQPGTQAALLTRFPIEKMRSFFLTGWYQRERMIQAIHPTNLTLFFKLLGEATCLTGIRNDWELQYFLKNNHFKKYNKEEFLLEVISKDKLTSLLEHPSTLANILEEFIPQNKRIAFLDYIGEVKLSALLCKDKSGYDLSAILRVIPPNDKFNFILKLHTREQLRVIRDNPDSRSYWGVIKSCIRNEKDRQTLHELIYSTEELSTKAILKNIKRTLQSTREWSFGFSETRTHVTLRRTPMAVPENVIPHIDQFLALKQRTKSYSEALEEIKRHGKATADTYKTYATSFSNLFYRNITQEYFNKFDSEEKFNEAFVPKPKT